MVLDAGRLSEESHAVAFRNFECGKPGSVAHFQRKLCLVWTTCSDESLIDFKTGATRQVGMWRCSYRNCFICKAISETALSLRCSIAPVCEKYDLIFHLTAQKSRTYQVNTIKNRPLNQPEPLKPIELCISQTLQPIIFAKNNSIHYLFIGFMGSVI